MNMNRLHFQVERDEGDIDIDAMIAGVKVGHVKTVRDGDRLLLADLNVADSIPRQWPVFPNLLRAVLGERPPWSARGKGIGRELLRRVLEEADTTGVCEIWGSMTSRDIKKTPYLVKWYERLGFLVREPDGECIRDAAQKVVRPRPARQPSERVTRT